MAALWPLLSGLLHYQHLFRYILYVLQDQLFQPRQRFVRPALGVEGHHDLIGQAAIFCGIDDVAGGAVHQALSHPFILLRHFVADACAPAVPAAAGVGEVEDVVEVEVEVGFADDAQPAVVMVFPDVFAVEGRARTAVHADGFYGCQLPEFFQVVAEVIVGFFHVAVAGGEAFVMVADFVAQVANFPDDGFVPALGHGPEVVGTADVVSGLYFGKCQGVQWLVVHIVAQDDGLSGGVFQELREGLENKALLLQCCKKLVIDVQRKIQGVGFAA